jgi:hypothetical protein
MSIEQYKFTWTIVLCLLLCLSVVGRAPESALEEIFLHPVDVLVVFDEGHHAAGAPLRYSSVLLE